jgi:hypothetical protein
MRKAFDILCCSCKIGPRQTNCLSPKPSHYGGSEMARKYHTKTCLFCNKTFIPINAYDNFCCLSHKFWLHVIIKSDNKCWEWGRSKTSSGYGQLRFRGKAYSAHRAAWEITYGEIPNGYCVCHHCDNPRCCNPTHLFLGTLYDNAHDMINKGRRKSDKGELNPMSKLTVEKVLYIRDRISKGHVQKDIAHDLGISPIAVSNIKHKTRWAHVL